MPSRTSRTARECPSRFCGRPKSFPSSRLQAGRTVRAPSMTLSEQQFYANMSRVPIVFALRYLADSHSSVREGPMTDYRKPYIAGEMGIRTCWCESQETNCGHPPSGRWVLPIAGVAFFLSETACKAASVPMRNQPAKPSSCEAL